MPDRMQVWGRRHHPADPVLDRREIRSGCAPRLHRCSRKRTGLPKQRAEDARVPPGRRQIPGEHPRRSEAIIAVTEGWVLYREDPDLMHQRGTSPPVPTGPVGPTGS